MLMVLEHTPPLEIPDLDLQEPIAVAVRHREDAAFRPDQDSVVLTLHAYGVIQGGYINKLLYKDW